MDKTLLLNTLYDILLEAGKISCLMQENIHTELKSDHSPVTAADLALSEFIRRELSFLPPEEHMFFDEEEIDKNGTTPAAFFQSAKPYVWFTDPIAGTACYAAGMPFYAISIGVLKHGQPYAGGVYLPGLNEMYLSDGQHSYLYKTTEQEAVPRLLQTLPTDHLALKPLFQHASTTVLGQYDIISKKTPFVIMPAVNIGLMWTALGRFSASIIKLKLWDFAGAWAILKPLGIGFYNADTGAILEKITEENLSENWSLTETHIVCQADILPLIQQRITKETSD